ncbi:hypothetical protein TSAR_006382, partial [Trichomalopsis sarcophagae]
SWIDSIPILISIPQLRRSAQRKRARVNVRGKYIKNRRGAQMSHIELET